MPALFLIVLKAAVDSGKKLASGVHVIMHPGRQLRNGRKALFGAAEGQKGNGYLAVIKIAVEIEYIGLNGDGRLLLASFRNGRTDPDIRDAAEGFAVEFDLGIVDSEIGTA